VQLAGNLMVLKALDFMKIEDSAASFGEFLDGAA
jgi:hypothetical protein